MFFKASCVWNKHAIAVCFMSTATESSTEDSGKAQLEREITMIEQAPYEDRGEQVSRLLLRRLLVALFTFISR